MKRRTLLSLAPLSLLVPSPVILAAGEYITEFTPQAYDQALASGNGLLLDFSSKS